MRVRPFKRYPLWVRGLLYLQKKRGKRSLEPTLAWGILGRAYFYFLLLVKYFLRKRSSLNLSHRHLVMLYISKIRSCRFCVNWHEEEALKFFEKDKVGAILEFEKSSLFSEKEKRLLLYAKQASTPGESVSDKLFEKLKGDFSDKELVELTGLIAFQNMSSIFNSALDINP